MILVIIYSKGLNYVVYIIYFHFFLKREKKIKPYPLIYQSHRISINMTINY